MYVCVCVCIYIPPNKKFLNVANIIFLCGFMRYGNNRKPCKRCGGLKKEHFMGYSGGERTMICGCEVCQGNRCLYLERVVVDESKTE